MKKSVKLFAAVLGIVLTVLFLLANLYFLTDKRVSGLENFSPADCSLSLTANLFPSDRFLRDYPYIAGDYFYSYDGGFLQNRAAAFAWVRYSPDLYLQAKEYCSQQFMIDDSHCFAVDAYHFTEHLCYTCANAQGVQEVECRFPEHFNMFAFDDSECLLMFLGYYCSDKNDETTKLAETDFEAFLRDIYSMISG